MHRPALPRTLALVTLACVMLTVLIGGGYVVGIAVLLCLRRAVPR